MAALPDPRTVTKSGNFLTVSIVFVPTAKKPKWTKRTPYKASFKKEY